MRPTTWRGAVRCGASIWRWPGRPTNGGELLLAGVLAEPIDAAVFFFQGDSAEVAERFVAADPYVRDGLVVAWRVRRWDTVVGEGAANPIARGS